MLKKLKKSVGRLVTAVDSLAENIEAIDSHVGGIFEPGEFADDGESVVVGGMPALEVRIDEVSGDEPELEVSSAERASRLGMIPERPVASRSVPAKKKKKAKARKAKAKKKTSR